ncbi:hypothetical protein [Paraliobacillus sediminis]|uniref:hypothetical protein n=1 Tax=Paraliobacillus sediminis TaxID=1885916 RepID=UPI000E3E704F|nr:hypothetical protein [Paraliobacillus sediminis]
MSEEKKHESKKIIHVKDLVIKAENVHFEPTHQQRPEERSRPFDAFFGKRREEEAVQEDRVEEVRDEEVKEEQEEALETEKREERRPFSWL